MAKPKKILEDEIYEKTDRQTRVVLCFADIYRNGTLKNVRQYAEENDIIFYGKNKERIDFSTDKFYTLIGNQYYIVGESKNLSEMNTPLFVMDSATGNMKRLNISGLFDESEDKIKQQRLSILEKNKKQSVVDTNKTNKKNMPKVIKETANDEKVKAFKKKHYSPIKKNAETLAGLTLATFPFTLLIGGIVLELAVVMLAVAALSYFALSFVPKLFKVLSKRNQIRKENIKAKEALKNHEKDFEKNATKEAKAKNELSNVRHENEIMLTRSTGKFKSNNAVNRIKKICKDEEASELVKREAVDPNKNKIEDLNKPETTKPQETTKSNQTENNDNFEQSILKKKRTYTKRVKKETKYIEQVGYFDEAKQNVMDDLNLEKPKYFDEAKQKVLDELNNKNTSTL